MKYLSLFLIAFVINFSSAHAQDPMHRFINQLDLNGDVGSLSIDHYNIVEDSALEIDGKEFSKLTLIRKVDFKPSKVSKEDYFFFANFLGDAAVGYQFTQTPLSQDKLLHAYAGYVIANLSNGIFQIVLPKEMKHRRLISALLGFGMSALVGGAKEFYDAQHRDVHTPDIKDFMSTIGGGLAGTLTMTFDLRKCLYGKY